MSEVDELYVMARRVLLDALDALGSHRGAIVLVGAQAVYLRVGEADLAVAPFTTDGDLAIDPAVLAEIPPLEKALMEAGFYPKPRTPSASGSRNARRATRGLEVRVAGLAALLVAKVHKIGERHGTDRQSAKDARRPSAAPRHRHRRPRHTKLLADNRSAEAAKTGRELLETQFAKRAGIGVEMAIRSAGALASAEEIAASCEALASLPSLRSALRGRDTARAKARYAMKGAAPPPRPGVTPPPPRQPRPAGPSPVPGGAQS
jgi:hypothetical protein